MSTVTTVIVILGALATALFAAGFLRGLREAIQSRHGDAGPAAVSEKDHWPSVVFAIVVSALVIAAIGFLPQAVYAGPFLVLVTAAATGIAFFLDRSGKRPAR